MRHLSLTLIVLLSVLFLQGFTSATQNANPTVIILDHNGQPTTQITDGDTIQLQVTLPQPVKQQENINLLFDDARVGSCLIPSGNTTCKTDPFPSLGWHWTLSGFPKDTAMVLAETESEGVVAQSDAITIKPRPVVLVYGFVSNAQTWTPYLGENGYLASLGLHGFAIDDGQVPGKMNTGNILDPTSRTNTIAQNAEVLDEYINGVKQKTGAQMVDLVIHSMGGMISRYYIDRVMQERDVAQLIMLGSPMGGSDCAVLPATLGFYLPASIEIRESYMRGVFNQQITHRHGIGFFDLSGIAIDEAFESPCTGVPNDTVVSLGSVNAIPLQVSTIDEIHSNLTFSKQVFTDFVSPLLRRSTGTFTSAPDPVPTSQVELPLEFTRVYTGHVDAGGSTELTINIDAGLTVASFALYDASRSITTVVRGASGNVIELSPEANGFIQLDDPSSLFYLGYGFQNPKPGPWHVTVQATDKTPFIGTDFAVSVYFVGGAKLEATSNTLIPQINEQVRFDASLWLGGQLLEITQAKAEIKDSVGNIQTLDFPPGQNISTTWTPTQAGTYAVDIVVTGTAPDSSTIERTDFLAIEVQPNPSKGQITFNFIVVITVIALILLLVLYFVFRGTRGVICKVRS